MIQQYLEELSKVQLLLPAEEVLLWKRFKLDKSREARQRLIESYQPLVFKIASRITGREDLFFDLIQEGTVGLIEAVESFDLKHAVKFSTFAQYRIRGRMIDFLKRQRSNQESLELAIYEDEFESLIAKVADEQVNIEDEVTYRVINQQVNQAISRLNPKEQKVIYDLYLLDKEPLLSAKEMNISLSYFYKLQKKALQRLRGMLSKLRSEIKANG
ncbi:MAG: sigma-70 family RNA polymerase sigma factor [Bacillota bacterium]